MKLLFVNKKNPNFSFELTFIKGKFVSIKVNFKKFTSENMIALFTKIIVDNLAKTRENLAEYWEESQEGNRQEKYNPVAIWCKLYQQRYKVAYKITDSQAGLLNNLGATEEEFEDLVIFFFGLEEWWAKTKNTHTFVKYINEIRRLQANPVQEEKPKAKFPDEYSIAFEKGLNGNELSDYWAYLRSIGWKKTDRGWVKTNMQNGEKLARDLAAKFAK
jgi:hypothetical protein